MADRSSRPLKGSRGKTAHEGLAKTIANKKEGKSALDSFEVRYGALLFATGCREMHMGALGYFEDLNGT